MNKHFQKFLFSERVQLNSDLSKEEILNRVESRILNVKNFNLIKARRSSMKAYEGFVKENRFSIRRILKVGFSAYLPIITGEIQTNGNSGTIIEIVYSLHPIIKTMLFIMLIFTLGMFFLNLSSVDSSEPFIEQIKNSVSHEEFKKINSKLSYNNSTRGKSFSLLIISLLIYMPAYLFFKHQVSLSKMDIDNILKVNPER